MLQPWHELRLTGGRILSGVRREVASRLSRLVLADSGAGLPTLQCKSVARPKHPGLPLSVIDGLDQMISPPTKFSSRPRSEKVLSRAAPCAHRSSVRCSCPTVA